MSASKGSSQSQSQTGVWGGQSPYLNDLYSQAQGLAGTNPQMGQEMAGAALPAWQSMLNPQGNPYLQGMGEAGLNQINRNFQQNIMPGIEQGAASGMNLGSSRQGVAQGIAAQGAAQAGSDYLTNLYGQQYQQDQNRALQALGMGGQVAALPWSNLQNYAGIIGGPHNIGSSSSSSKSFGAGL